MSGKLEDITCKDCGINWSDLNGDGWLLRFEDGPDPKQNRLLWAQCRGCQSGQDRFAVDVSSGIHWLPETPEPGA